KTCIYKASDVPAETRRDDIDFAKPITCFEWQSVYVYDFDKGAFQANWADVPRPEEPYMRVKVYLLVIFITLFIALALVTFSRLGNFLSQKIATNQTYSRFRLHGNNISRHRFGSRECPSSFQRENGRLQKQD